MFHPLKGKNIKLDKKKIIATWTPVDSGGQLFSCQCLDENHELILDLNGSGGVELGIINRKPNQGRQNVRGNGTDQGNYQFLNDVKIHRRSCKIRVRINYEKQVRPEKNFSCVSGDLTFHTKWLLTRNLFISQFLAFSQNDFNSELFCAPFW